MPFPSLQKYLSHLYSSAGTRTHFWLDEEGRATLKVFRPEEGRVRLEPANPELAPIYVRNVRIQGVLRTVIRRVP